MGAIYLRHDIHGTKVAIAEAEAEADEKNGWKRYDVAAILKPRSDAKPHVEDSEMEKLREEYEAKFGKRPHHKKNLETLKAELEAT